MNFEYVDLKYELMFTSVGCACRPNTLGWCNVTSYILYAAQKDICIAGLDEVSAQYRLLETVEKAHSSEITFLTLSMATVVNAESEVYSLFCSATSSGELAIWKLRKTANDRATLIRRMKKDSNIELAKMGLFNSDRTQIVLGILQFDHIDVHILNLEGEDLCPASSHKFRNSIASTFEISQICGALVMAVGLSSGMVEVFAAEPNSYSFQKKLSLDLSGNKSWARSLAFKNDGTDRLLLAAASDGMIKIWKFDGADESSVSTNDELRMAQRTFCIQSLCASKQTHRIAVALESVLHDHSESIYSLAWHPDRLELLSSGSNQSVVRWAYSLSDSIWLPISRFGEIVGEETNCYDVTYSPCGKFVLCHSLLGGFYFWEIGQKGVFPRCFPIGGHFAEVTDLCWDRSGTILLTCGSDMTTRVFARNKNLNVFFELARPQTHGHPMNCLTSVQSDLFVSGGEEKIFRVFQATSSFAQNLDALSDNYTNSKCFSSLPITAFQTELTLTNKAVTDLNGDESDVCPRDCFLFAEPPREEQLNRFTLFPEVHKLYGHGFEVFSCASSRDGRVLATCCKASHFEHANILLWDTSNWKLMKSLKAHQLTVTRLSFSYDDKFLLSVSRDRTWTLFHLNEGHSSPSDYELFYRAEKASAGHNRIIWDCSWSPDSHLFATVSRDKTLKLWDFVTEGKGVTERAEVANTATFVSTESQTAVDFAPKKSRENSYLIAVGFEDGAISLFDYNTISRALQPIVEFSRNFAHSGRINRLRFQPVIDGSHKQKSDEFLLASASDCHTVKIYGIKI